MFSLIPNFLRKIQFNLSPNLYLTYLQPVACSSWKTLDYLGILRLLINWDILLKLQRFGMTLLGITVCPWTKLTSVLDVCKHQLLFCVKFWWWIRRFVYFRCEYLMYFRLYLCFNLAFIPTNSSKDIPPSPSKSIFSIVDFIQSSSKVNKK